MGAKPEELRRDIEATRAQLGEDLDQLTEKISPGRVASRKAADARTAASGLAAKVSSTTAELRPKVVGGAQHAKVAVKGQLDAHPAVGAKAQQAKESAEHAAKATSAKAKQQPAASGGVAAGLIAVLTLLVVRRRRSARRSKQAAAATSATD